MKFQKIKFSQINSQVDIINTYKILHRKLTSFPLSKVRSITIAYNKAFHAKLFTLFASSESEMYTFAEIYPQHYDYCFCFLKDDQAQWYLEPRQIEKLRSWISIQLKDNPKKIISMYREWLVRWNKYLELDKQLHKTNLSKLSNRQLYSSFENFHRHYVLAGATAYITDAFMSQGEEDWLEQLISQELTKIKVNKEEITTTLRTLTSPAHLSFSLEAEYQLLKTARFFAEKYCQLSITVMPPFTKLQNIFPEGLVRLQQLEKKFHWIRNNYYHVHYISAKEFYAEVNRIIIEANNNRRSISALLAEKEQELREIRKSRQNLVRKLRVSPFLNNLLEITWLFTKWKDVRKSGVYIGMYHYDRFLRELAKRTRYSKNDVCFLVFDEIKELLFNRKNVSSEIYQRKKRCFFSVTSKGYFLVGGKQADAYFSLNKNPDPHNYVEIRGVVACTGYARGRVKIIKKTDQMKQFKLGEILVTNQTTPEFLPIMKKASAIITDQGGITSHAAVISRELGKPCIIGTKIATSCLMDGEMVEVDANNGVIRRER